MSYFYYMYGLYLESEIQLYNTHNLETVFSHEPDIKINISYHFIQETENQNRPYCFEGNRIWFKTMAGCFLVENGNRVFAAPYKNVSNSLLSAFIIGWCINFIMYQRGSIGIHCSALCKEDLSFFVSGCSGSGKSTTAMALINTGYKYMADDLAFISSKNNYLIYPGLPLQKMCKDVAVSVTDTEKLLYIDELKDKYAKIDKSCFNPSPVKLSAFFHLEVCDSDIIEHKTITGFNKVRFLLNSIFMSDMFGTMECPTDIKAECLRLAGKIPVIQIKRPKNKNTTDEICAIITKYLEDLCQQ